jgi:O-antigen/teichoic acid export membrane protein
MLAAVWIAMPARERAPRFAVQVLHDVWVFALSDGLALLVGVGMSLADRIVLSRLLPLDAFGSYSLAILIGDIVLRIVGPFSTAYFPHFADLLARKDARKVSEDYGHAGAIVSVLFVPAFVAFAAFAEPIMHLASGSAEIAAAFAWVLALRALGNGIIGLQYMPHALQLAAGVATTALYVNIVALCFYLPGIVVLSPIYGYLVPGILWLFVVSIQTPVMIYVTHRITLRGEAWAWTMESIIRPLAAALVVILPLAALAHQIANITLSVLAMGLAFGLAGLAIIAVSPRLRATASTIARRLSGQPVRSP